MVFQAEKTLREYGDRIPSELKTELDTKVQAVKEILENDPRERRPAAPGLRGDGAVPDPGRHVHVRGGRRRGRRRRGRRLRRERRRRDGTADDEATVDGEFREVGSER